ncbi:hypothetical protein DRQ25_14745 [Candidatus Fermentibacteria bacterium]|nr:MAG: hypothetical protein DRQ25_14745 [Candidatus Fermentibacteria bacterium]
MNQHTIVEKRLKTDIHYKNAVRRDLVDSVRQLHDWQEKLNQLHNIRKEKKLKKTVERYRGFIEDMRTFLAPLLDELEDGIKEEMSFSEDEIKEFKLEVKEETILASEARIAFEKARDAADSAENSKLEPEELVALKEAYSKAWRAFRLEKHRLDEATDELQSEQTDRDIFKMELKRIHVERHFIKEV